MDQLWAPWRLDYVKGEKPPQQADACFICRGLSECDDRNNFIVHRGRHCVVILNRYPYNNGHLLIAPNAHKPRLQDLEIEEAAEIHQVMCRCVSELEGLMGPQGFNVGLNLGKAAGAGLPGHLHWHIVPRWIGDTNFMPVLGDTRVIVQSLEALYEMLEGKL